MKTIHRLYCSTSAAMKELEADSIDLVVTSPPYPMIEMWDDLFIQHNPEIAGLMARGGGMAAFEKMHQLLDAVWKELMRVVRPGGIVCINIGDAVRTLQGGFMLYANHARILTKMTGIGFSPLPEILWRKQTNAPNKFMGSGMLPPSAYVTLEHEFILIFRKKENRTFLKPAEKTKRRESAYFWEERNIWFSDVWMDLKGTTQRMFDDKIRKRSGAFPFALPFRLISMFSVKGDTVLDPFFGLGTTAYAAMAAARNSVGYELDAGFAELFLSGLEDLPAFASACTRQRLENHLEFVKLREAAGKSFKHENAYYGFPVITAQERELRFHELLSVQKTGDHIVEACHDIAPV